MNPFYAAVAHRAKHRCEYCRAPEVLFNFCFEVEHVDPKSLGGSDMLSNLALSCRSCNLFKSDASDGYDVETGMVSPLFHPRIHRWEEHFGSDGLGQVIGITPIGRATIARLHMNSDSQVNARRQWKRLGLFE